MNNIWVRAAIPEDLEWIRKFYEQRPAKYGFDPRTLGYPTTRFLVAFDADGPIVALPFYTAAVLGSFAASPEASDLRRTRALHQLLQQAAFFAFSTLGVPEIWFATDETQETDLCARLGFVPTLPAAVLKFVDLDKKKAED